MTTATETAINVGRLTPVIDIFRFSKAPSDIDVTTTASVFVDSNLRHIVNRRMRWTLVSSFVTEALNTLIRQVSNYGLIPTVVVPQRTAVFEAVRDAANRRRAWSTVYNNIQALVSELIFAAKAAK